MNSQLQRSLFGLDAQELTELVESSGQPAYRGRQLFQALYRERISSAEQVTTLPKDFRAKLSEQGFVLGLPAIDAQFSSSDGTIRYLMRLQDGETIETVWMPEGDDGESGDGTDTEGNSSWHRATICVSSQVGCAVNCQFCLTALLGVKRNLTAGEIVGQVVTVLQERGVTPPLERVNLVFMGMGEPLLNYDNFVILPELLDDYIDMVKGLVDRFYSEVSRYTTSAFLHMKLGDALSRRDVAPHIYESREEAEEFLTARGRGRGGQA